MSVFNLLLRALLCMGLILNGSGYAVAAMDMQMAHAHMAMPDAVHSDMSGPGCDAHALAIAAHNAEPVNVTDTHAHASSNPDAPACCDASTCKYACDTPPPATTVLPLRVSTTLAHDVSVPMLETGRLSPALARLNRPPIH